MRYLTETEVLVIHARIVDATSGAHGVREIELMRSIVERPKTAFGGKDMYPDVFEKAACYLESTAKFHVFVDGNKRTSFALAVRFLETNRYIFVGENVEVERFVLSVVTHKLELTDIAVWLKKNSKKAKPTKNNFRP